MVIPVFLLAVIACFSCPVLSAFSDGNVCTSEAFPPTDTSRAVGFYEVNSDEPPEKRWTPLIKAKKNQMAALINHIKTVLFV